MKGQVIDSITQKPIEYVHIVENDNLSISNSNGEFQIKTHNNRVTKLILSCIGYNTKQILATPQHLQDGFILINLSPKIYELDEIMVRDSTINATAIVKKAANAIPTNYIQKEFGRQEFVRIKRFDDRGVPQQILNTQWNEYRKYGYSVKKNNRSIILQHVHTEYNTSEIPINDEHIFWVDFYYATRRDINFYSDPWTQRNKYEYHLSDSIFEFNDVPVFLIKYTLLNPEKFSNSGHGNSKSVTGKIYIEENTFAILRVEEEIEFHEMDSAEMMKRHIVRKKEFGHDDFMNHVRIYYVLNFTKYKDYYFLTHSNSFRTYWIYDPNTERHRKESTCVNLLVTGIQIDSPEPIAKSNWLYSKASINDQFSKDSSAYLDENTNCLQYLER